MSGVTTFGAFTTARLGIFAAQKALDVTGHNITNINTNGYTRQMLNQVSFRTGGHDRYQPSYAANVGNGVLCVGVSQLRDPYLDIRYRGEQASVGATDAKLAGLEELSSILDEVGKGDGDGVIEKQLNDLITQLQNLNTQGAGKPEYDTLVRSSATTLVQLFNTYASKLNEIQKNKIDSFQKDLEKVNGILDNIQNLNASIRRSEIHGDQSLEQRDQRNLLIDELSQYVKIDVSYGQEDIGGGQMVEKLIIRLGGTGQTGADRTDQSTLIDGLYAGKFSIKQEFTLNPAFNEKLPNSATNPQYLKPKEPVLNPAFDETQPNSETNPKYLTADPKPNPAFDTDPTQPKYLDKDGNPTDDKAMAARIPTNDVKQAEMKSEATDDPTLAEHWNSPNYDLNLSALKDARGNLLQYPDPNKPGDMIDSADISLKDNDLYGALQATREMITETGEFSTAADKAIDPNAAIKRGIPYYQKSLDAMARKFAEVMNGANQIPEKTLYETNEAGEFVLDKDGNKILKDGYKEYNGGALFSNHGTGDKTEDITAGNISISQSWATGSVRILKSTAENPTSQDNSNIVHIINQINSKQEYRPNEISPADGDTVYFRGNFQEMLTNITATLANDTNTTEKMLNNYAASALELDNNRSSVSGVDLNDEAASMMQYQKSYAAACRLMTTIDEVLDKLINGTGVVGR